MRRYAPAFLLAAAAFTAACDEKLSSIAGPTPDLAPTFSTIQRDVFGAADSTGRRACASCHTSVGRVPSGGLDLSGDGAYDRIVNRPANLKAGAIYIIPGDPDGSYMVQKLEGAPGISGVRMPFGGPYLQDGQIQIIRRWITNGAPRN